MAKLKTEHEYIQALEQCREIFEAIESGEVKSISTARKIARSAIGDINKFLYASEREKVLQRIRFAISRGHEINREDVKGLLKIAEEIL